MELAKIGCAALPCVGMTTMTVMMSFDVGDDFVIMVVMMSL